MRIAKNFEFLLRGLLARENLLGQRGDSNRGGDESFPEPLQQARFRSHSNSAAGDETRQTVGGHLIALPEFRIFLSLNEIESRQHRLELRQIGRASCRER